MERSKVVRPPQEVTPAMSQRIGYKVLYSIFDEPEYILRKVGAPCISEELADSELKGAAARAQLTVALEPMIAHAASWFAEVLADRDYDDDDDNGDGLESVKEEYSGDLGTFGVTLLGILLEEGYVVMKE